MRSLFARLAGLITRRRDDQALDEEIAAHLELLAAEYERRGMTPDDARFAARRAFGGVEPMKERYRDRRGLRWLDESRRDVRYGLRMLARSPGFAAVSVLTLALGVGASTALFSVVYDHVFRKLPVANPDELVTFRWIGAQDVSNMWSGSAHIAGVDEGGEAGSSFSFAMLSAFRAANQTLAGIVAFAPVGGGLNVFTGTQAERSTGMFVSGDFYRELGIAPIAGRVLTPADDAGTAAPVALISDAYWRRRFASAPDAIGRAVVVNDVPVTIVGVVPAAGADLTNRGFLEGADFAMPLSIEPQVLGANSMLRNPANWWVMLVGRLRPAVSFEQVETNFAPVYRQSALDGWQIHVSALPAEQRLRPGIQQRGTQVPRLQVVSAARGVSDLEREQARQFAMLAAIFALGLVIVCVNLVNLLLSRTAVRQQEIAVRLSLGATHARVIRQLLVESVVLGLVGAAAGWPIAIVCRALAPVPLAADQAEWPAMVFAGGLSVVAALAVGLVSAVRATRSGRPLSPTAGGRQTASWRIGNVLMAAQVSLSLVLLVSAALLVRTVVNLQRVPLGFDPADLVLFELQPTSAGYDRAAVATLYERLVGELRRVPGVRAVATAGAGSGILWGTDSNGDVFLEGGQGVGSPTDAKFQFVDLGFFDTMGIRLRQGRMFTPLDSAPALPVAIVNDAFVKAFFAGANPLGRRFATQADAPAARLIEIVGVVSDVRVSSLRRPAPPMFYRPIAQTGAASRTVAVRAMSGAERLMPAIAAVVERIDPRLPLRRMQTQADYLRGYTTDERVLAAAAGAFGALSLAVAMIGLVGLMSYAVTRRTREIGIRMAVGARPADVLRRVIGEALIVVGVGVAGGVPAALAAARLLDAIVFELSPYDPPSVLAAVVLMVCVAGIAAYAPARRAARVDPIVALRAE
jgi:predicted permease